MRGDGGNPFTNLKTYTHKHTYWVLGQALWMKFGVEVIVEMRRNKEEHIIFCL